MRVIGSFVLLCVYGWVATQSAISLAQDNSGGNDKIVFQSLPSASDPLDTKPPSVPGVETGIQREKSIQASGQLEALRNVFSEAYGPDNLLKSGTRRTSNAGGNNFPVPVKGDLPPSVDVQSAPQLFPPTGAKSPPGSSLIRQSRIERVHDPRSPQSEFVELPPLKVADASANGFSSLRVETDPGLPVFESENPVENEFSSFSIEGQDGGNQFRPAGHRKGSDTSRRERKGVFEPGDNSLADANPLWWKNLIQRPLHPNNSTEVTNTSSLVYAALKNSPRIQAISQEPLVRELQVLEAEAGFDTELFVRSQFDDRVDPVGNELTTGGEPFLKDNIWSGETGFRRKLLTGGELEAGQTLGFQNSNSRFFVPQDQGTATLSLSLSQPLLKGRGIYYNQSQILIAQSAGGAAWETFETQLQDELQNVVKAYWQLYFERSVFLQKRRNVARGEVVLNLLEGRQGFDALPIQIARAKSAVLSRRAELSNSFRDIRNAETELRRLVASPDWLANQNIEMLPSESPEPVPFDIGLDVVVETALQNRPEIKEAIKRSKIAAFQYDVSTNELLPELTLLLNTYVSALEGGTGIERALTGQFSNTPGYSVGFEFGIPINNRVAKSRVAQRDVRKSKIKAELEQSIQTVIAESQFAERRLKSAFETLDAALAAIDAARFELIQNQKRWEAFGLVEGDIAEGQTPTNVLDQLLDSQDRLFQAELVYTQTEVDLKIAEVDLQRAMGTLLQHHHVAPQKVWDYDRPTMAFGSDSGS